MRRAVVHGALIAATVACAACSDETAILVDVSWDPALAVDADTLRLYVGTGTADSPDFIVSDAGGAHALVGVTTPYRYVLRPEGALEDIGALQLAAALTSGGDRIVPRAFAVAPTPVSFADGELRLVRLELTAARYVPAGPLGECALWGASTGSGSIGRPGDVDCDGTLDNLDCAPRDPTDTSSAMDSDGDGVTCGDCLDGDAPAVVGGWMIDPGTVFPGQSESVFRAENQIPPTVDCLHVDFDCSGSCGDGNDSDSSGSDECGSVELGQDAVSCPAQPSDCDESEPGPTPSTGDAERCDGRDSNCDGRPQPPVPCALDLGGPVACRVGVSVCDDAAGRYDACVPDAVLGQFTFDEACQTLHAADSCRFDDDPLGCAAASASVVRTCKIAGGDAACASGERLTMPGKPASVGCTWRVVGGTAQADWDVGFVARTAPVGSPPTADTTACAPALVVRAVNDDPVRRTVMIVGEPAIGLGARAYFLTLDDDSTCDGVFTCSPGL